MEDCIQLIYHLFSEVAGSENFLDYHYFFRIRAVFTSRFGFDFRIVLFRRISGMGGGLCPIASGLFSESLMIPRLISLEDQVSSHAYHLGYRNIVCTYFSTQCS
jgi:hypothetical protein